MALLGCRATSICANRNGRTYCLMGVLACTEPEPALSVQAGFGLCTINSWPLVGLVVPVALGWGVQGSPWPQLGYHMLAGAQQQPEACALTWRSMAACWYLDLSGELSINHGQLLARSLGRTQILQTQCTLVLGLSQYRALFFLGCSHRGTLVPELLHSHLHHGVTLHR